MGKRPIALLALLVAALGVSSAAAQDVDVRVNVAPREVPANGQVRVEIVVSGPEAGNATLEGSPKGKQLIPGGGVSTSSSIQIVNGQMSASKTFSLVYLPSGAGAAQVPSFVVTVNGRQHRTQPVSVTITAASAKPAPQPGATDDGAADLPIQVVADLSRSRIYQGESVTLSYRLLFRQRVTGMLAPQSLEPIPDFVVEDLEANHQIRQVQHQGAPWQEVVLFRRRLTPTKAGRLTIDPVLFRFQADDPRARSSFFGFGRSIVVDRTARAVRIEVRPLPQAGRPADFSGAVGTFRMKAALDRTDLAAGDAAALTVTVEGDGPLASATPPRVPEVADLRVFDPDVEGGRRDRRTWTYPVVPQTAGAITLPSIRWSYFDPRAERYRTLESQPLTMTVAPGAAPAATEARGGRRVQRLASDLRFIKPAPAVLPDRLSDVYRRGWYWSLVGLPLAAFPALLLAGWYRERLDRTGVARERRAARRARARLKEALGSLEQGNGSGAQRLAAAAIAGYVADRAQRSPQGLTHDALVELATRGGCSEEAARSLLGVVERFDELQYMAAGVSADDTRRLIGEGEQVITRLEKEWR